MSSEPPRRSPLWFCYECHAEMRPLMIPDPHCASCNSTFLEELGGMGDEDPRQIAAENDRSEALLSFLNQGFFNQMPYGMSPSSGPPPPRSGGYFPSSRSTRPSNNPPLGMGSGGTMHFEVRSGPGGTRTWTFHRGGSTRNNGANASPFPAEFPSFPEFVQQRMGSPPTSPVDDEIETPYGPRSTRNRGQMPPLPDDPRTFLMQYLMGMLSGNPALLFDEPGGQFQGGGAFGDYVFSQEGLDRIITQLMEATGHPKPNPAPEDMISRLPRTKLTYDCGLVKSGQSCAICTEYFAPPEASSGNENKTTPQSDENSGPGSGVAITLPCAHAFHDDCIITWLKTNGTCPVCRYALVEQPSPNESNNAGVPTMPPGAASTSAMNISAASTSPPNTDRTSNNIVPGAFPLNNSEPPQPPLNRNASSSSAQSSSAPSPDAQAETVLNTFGGAHGIWNSILGAVTGHGRRREESGGGRSSSDNPSSSGTSSSRRRENHSPTSSPSGRPSSPPIFFADRFSRRPASPNTQRTDSNTNRSGQGNGNSRSTPGSPNHWTDVD